MDEEGGALFNITHPSDSVVLECMRNCARSLLSPRKGPFEPLIHHFLSQGVDTAFVCMQVLRRCVLGLTARLWHLHLEWTSFPYRLVRLVASDTTVFEKAVIAQALFALSQCCIDSAFSLKVRQLAGTPAGLLQHHGLLAALFLWALRARVTNMHTERLIALEQRASPARCAVQRALCAGYLAQIMSLHQKAGGLHPSSTTRSDLIEAGVPVRAAGLSSKAKKGRAQKVRAAIAAHRTAVAMGKPTAEVKGHFKFWANHKHRMWNFFEGASTRQFYRQRCQALRQKWDGGDPLSDDDVSSGGDEDKAARTYRNKIQNRLWQCSNNRWPVLPSRLEAVADTLAPARTANKVAGLTARLAEVRKDFLDSLLFGPEDTPVPLKQRLATETVCPPGACKLKAQSGQKVAQAELDRVLAEKPVGTLLEVTAEYPEEGFAPRSLFLAKALQTKNEVTFVECRRDHLGSPYFPPALDQGFAFLTSGKLVSDLAQRSIPTALQVIFFEMVGDTELSEDSLLFPFPQQIEEVGRAEVVFPLPMADADSAPASGSAGLGKPAESDHGKTELSDLESAALLPDEQEALQLETSLVGGLKQLRARRKVEKIRKRTRTSLAKKKANKRKAVGAQRSSPPGADVLPPPVAEPLIRRTRHKEKNPTVEVLPDGSYIRLSVNSDGTLDMRAVCAEHTLGQGALECNLSRTCRPGRRGRPLGFMMWFLECAKDCADKAAHKAISPHSTQEARQAARARFIENCCSDDVPAVEPSSSSSAGVPPRSFSGPGLPWLKADTKEAGTEFVEPALV